MRKIFLIAAFIEGFSVMAIEVAGARIIIPVYGTSLTSWSLVLAITLFGLAAGYYMGGKISHLYLHKIKLEHLLFATGIVLIAIPFYSKLLLFSSLSLSFLPGLILSLFIIIFPPLILLGAVTPIIIHHFDKNVGRAGLSAGNVFALSTLGGIIGALLCGIYLLPTFGIRITIISIGIILFILAAVITSLNSIKLISVLFLSISLILVGTKSKKNTSQKIKILYSSEGILGQVKVVQFPFRNNLNENQCMYSA